MKNSGRFARVPLRAASMEISPQALRVLIVIGAHLDRTGWAYPSLSTIAALTELVRHKVPPLIAKLEDAGLLRRDRSTGGRGNPTRYQVVFSEPETVPPQRNVFPGNSPLPGERFECETVPCSDAKQSPPRGLKHIRIEEDSERARASWFMKFWHVYPSRGDHLDGQEPARREFAAAIERGIDPEAIIAGAESYAGHIADTGTPPRFVKAAANWLRDERWTDRPRPVERRRPRAGMN